MKKVFLLLMIVLSTTYFLTAQSNLTVNIDDPVYLLIEMAEVKGYITRVSQVRPYPVTRIRRYLEEINGVRNRLSQRQIEVLDEQRRRFGLVAEDERSWWQSGRVDFGGEGTDMENFPIRVRMQADNITNMELNSMAFQNVTPVKIFLEGDITSHFSYGFNVGFGASFLNPAAFEPFGHITYNDGFALGMSGSLNDSTTYNGFAVTFHFMPEMQAQFLDDRVRVGMGRYARSMGPGSGGLTVSGTARPYDALELEVRPAKWLNYYFSVGSLGNWFSQRAWMGDVKTGTTGFPDQPQYEVPTDEKNLTLQVLEIMPVDWMYLNMTTGAVWGKRMEIGYFNPLMPLLFSQNLYGDADNLAMEMTGAFPLPFGVKIYGTFFADEVQFNDLGTLFTDTSQQFGIQAGLKGLIPGLGFTLGTFQYTKLEPYVYTHYEQVYPSTTALVNTNWTNDRYNLGYYLPPNSDEFLLQLESMPAAGLKLYGKYRYIRHGYGNWDNPGEIEGTVDSGGAYTDTGDDDRHAYQDRPKNFLKDGPYERIHMATLGGEYQFPGAPFRLGMEYTFSYAENDRADTSSYNPYSAYTPYSGVRNAVSIFITVYPEY